MDNGEQVNKNMTQSKKIFLRGDLKNLRKEKVFYDLNTEFGKTRKNRKLIVPGIIAAILLIFLTSGYGVTYFIQQNSKNVKVDLKNEMSDLGLRDLLKKQRTLESELTRLRTEYMDLKKERDDEIAMLNKDAEQKILLADNSDMSDDERKIRVDEIKMIRLTVNSRKTLEYEKKLTSKQAQIDGVQKKLDESDANKVALAKAQESLLNNQRKLFDIEVSDKIAYYDARISELTRSHESLLKETEQYYGSLINTVNEKHARAVKALILKYNPIFESDALRTLLRQVEGMELQAPVLTATRYQDDLLAKETSNGRENYAKLIVDINELNIVLDRVRQVGYLNDIPASLGFILYKESLILKEYEALWHGLADAIADKNKEIAQLNEKISGLDTLFTEQVAQLKSGLDSQINPGLSEVGLILVPTDPNKLILYISKDAHIAIDDIFSLYSANYRNDWFPSRIATIRIISITNNWSAVATIEKLEQTDKQVLTFDKVLDKE